jgi:flagellar assembly factor FliW
MNVVSATVTETAIEYHPHSQPRADEILSVPEESEIVFGDGLVGCEDWKRFVLQETMEAGPFKLLQSLDDPRVSFVVTDPYLLLPDYSFEMTEADVEKIGLESASDALVLCILVVKQEPELSVTANLLGPLVINVKQRRGVQVILAQSGYSARFPVFGRANGTQGEHSPVPEG